MYNKKPTQRAPAAKKVKVEAAAGEDGDRLRLKQMRKSEKLISQTLNDSVKAESSNASMLANMSLESIKSEHENAEKDIEWSAAGKILRARTSKKNEDKVLAGRLTRLELPRLLKGSTLLFIIYSALNICDSDLQLSDIIRFVREGHLSYFNLRQFLPDEITEQDVPLSFHEYHCYKMINYERVRLTLSNFVRIIPDLVTSFRTPNLIALARRYVDELALPSELGDCIERLMTFNPPKMRFHVNLPNYEGRAIAFVLFVLKLLFGIDGYREKEISTAARRVNKKAKPQRNIFVYEEWRKFIEYRQVILGKFYYPAMLYHENATVDRPHMAFNAMLGSLNPKTKTLESQVVTVRNERRMQAKANAMEMLTGLAKAHDKSTFAHFSFQSSLTPLKDNFEQILCSELAVDFNRKITDVNHADHSLEAFLSPQKLVAELAEEGIELHTKQATFPKCYVIVKCVREQREKTIYDLLVDETSTSQWREDLKERQEKEKEVKASTVDSFHRNQLEKMLAKRKMWRHLIREKKQMVTKVADDDIDGPQSFNEPNMLSESEDESETDIDVDDITGNEDPELEQLFQKHERSQLTLVVPDFNVWQHWVTVPILDPRQHAAILDKLPKSFLWLLKLAASVLHQHPMSVYHQLLSVEHQFMHVYQPVELMQNVLLKQDEASLTSKILSNRLEADW